METILDLRDNDLQININRVRDMMRTKEGLILSGLSPHYSWDFTNIILESKQTQRLPVSNLVCLI